jgi:membrane-bound lytic murein transglycosylase D
MNLNFKPLYLPLIILCLALFSGCSSSSPYARTEITGPAVETKAIENKNNLVDEKTTGISSDPVKDSVTPLQTDNEQVPFPDGNAELKQQSADSEEVDEPGDQELIDSALEYCQAASEFLEQGDADNAIDSLDKAYSYILKVDGADNPELLQQREDIRWTISKRIMEVYSTRFTAVNGNGKAIPLDMNSYVQKEIESFQGRERNFFLDAYARSGKYRPAIIKALKEAGFPEELSWLPLIESGFKVRAQSTARALGMWQFIASTGYRYGLKRDTWIDERMDPAKSTTAAIGYLSDLHSMFGDWKTVLAAYNCGEKRVLNEINRQKNSLLDDFWDLYQRLPNETARYVPRFLAVLHIIHDPAAYGFELPNLEQEDEYEEVTVNKQLSLATIAKSISVSDETLKTLNPELRQNATPKSTYNLKLPVGKGEVLQANISNIPSTVLAAYENSDSSTNTVHVVRSGDTLSSIAKKYRTSVKAIMNANNLKNENVLKVGARLKISSRKKTIISEANTSVSNSVSGGEVTRYVVKKGDSLYNIAQRYSTTVQSLKVLNGLSGSNLSVGQELVLYPGVSTASSREAETQKYTVKKGDYPAIIAKKHNMDLYEFLKMNGLTPASTIFPGQEVQVAME